MDRELIAALSYSSCLPNVAAISTPIIPPHPQITPPPPHELVHQHLQKRFANTCGVSGAFAATCGINSYCAYWGGQIGRWDCCAATISGGSSKYAASCTNPNTACLCSSSAVALFGGVCGPGTACCYSSAGPECITGILVVNAVTYSSFWCGPTARQVTVTPIASLTNPSTVVSQVTSVVNLVTTVTPTDKTVTVTPSTSTSSSSLSTSASSSETSDSLSSSTATTSSLSDSSATSISSSSSPSATGLSNVSGVTASSASTWGQHKGAIIGGVVAAVLLITLIALGFLIRHRKQVKKREAGLYDGPELPGRVVSGMSYTSVPTNSHGGSYGNFNGR